MTDKKQMIRIACAVGTLLAANGVQAAATEKCGGIATVGCNHCGASYIRADLTRVSHACMGMAKEKNKNEWRCVPAGTCVESGGEIIASNTPCSIPKQEPNTWCPGENQDAE